MAALGVTCGASVAKGLSVISFFAPINGSITGSSGQGIIGAGDAGGTFTQVVDAANGTITVTHNPITSATTAAILTQCNQTAFDARIIITSANNSGFTLNYVAPLQGIILGSGASAYSGPCAGVTVAWNATAGEEGYIITHPFINSTDDVVLVSLFPRQYTGDYFFSSLCL